MSERAAANGWTPTNAEVSSRRRAGAALLPAATLTPPARFMQWANFVRTPPLMFDYLDLTSLTLPPHAGPRRSRSRRHPQRLSSTYDHRSRRHGGGSERVCAYHRRCAPFFSAPSRLAAELTPRLARTQFPSYERPSPTCTIPSIGRGRLRSIPRTMCASYLVRFSLSGATARRRRG